MTNQEINIAVAEKVFGWKRLEGDAVVEWCCGWTKARPNNFHLKRIWVDGPEYANLKGCEECGSLPDFSGDIAQAWRILESDAISRIPSTGERMVELEMWMSGLWLRTLEVAPRVICTAVLKALGVDVMV